MSKKPSNSQLENRGLTVTSDIVKSIANHDWQTFDQINDDGVDGIILLRKKGIKTGEIFYIQVKCGQKTGGYYKEYLKRPNYFAINLTEEYIKKHKSRWNNVPGPMILIYVDYDSSDAWWSDLRDENSFSSDNKQIVLIPKRQKFGIHSFGEFRKLKGYTFIDPNLHKLKINVNDTNYISISESVKNKAKLFYSQWACSPINERNNPQLGEIIISRVGWRHITRKKRKISRIFQSFQLLGIAKRIINEVENLWQVKVLEEIVLSDGTIIITDFLSLRSKINFNFRGSTVVQVLLKRKRYINTLKDVIKSKIWFYSVYEPFSNREI